MDYAFNDVNTNGCEYKMAELKIGVICVSNDKKKFDTMLGASLNQQNIKYELVLVDNTDGRFKSAAEALNYGVNCTDADILIFSHQDICLKNIDALGQFVDAVQKKPIGCIVGIVGVKECSYEYYTNMSDGDNLCERISDAYEMKYYSVSSVDECFFGMRRETWEHHNFDKELCDNWHLYGVFVVSLIIVFADNFDFTTSFTSVLSMIGNVGPGLGLVGPTGNFSIYSDASKLVLIFDMLAGRLEIFPILVLFYPGTWRKA